MTKIFVFGASITYGAWDKEGGWVQRLRKFIDKKTAYGSKTDLSVYNLGVSGDTVEDLLERFEFETKQRLKEEKKAIFIFSIGINDSQFINSKKKLRYSPEKFRNNLEKLIKLAKKYSSKIVFVGLTPVDESKTNPIPWARDKSYENEYINMFNDIAEVVCAENKVYFVEIFENMMKKNYEKLLADGLHPNSKGHKKIFKIVKNFLLENKIILWQGSDSLVNSTGLRTFVKMPVP